MLFRSDAHSSARLQPQGMHFMAVNASVEAKRKAMLACLQRDHFLPDVSKDVGMEADVVFEDVEPALQQNITLQRAHEVVHHVLHAGKL